MTNTMKVPFLDLVTPHQELKAELLEGSTETRGLIGEGQKVVSRVRTDTFNPDPTPVMSVTISYYQP